ncbi:MAG: rRNA maturation RNase YbeY [Chthoniobacterales bacterium]|nr:MAG: rRNA maturation RNase YbeY [Chthoniobacterales bacterium]
MDRPHIHVRNAQRTISLNLRSLQCFAANALDLVWQRRCAASEIASLSDIPVSIVSDRRIAQLHEQFCDVRGPTDVLTFQHGEIVISAEAAARQGRAFRSPVEREIRLYLIHGLLHLAGYDDTRPRARAVMQRVQRSVLDSALEQERGGVV